jgi:hypothetical protein
MVNSLSTPSSLHACDFSSPNSSLTHAYNSIANENTMAVRRLVPATVAELAPLVGFALDDGLVVALVETPVAVVGTMVAVVRVVLAKITDEVFEVAEEETVVVVVVELADEVVVLVLVVEVMVDTWLILMVVVEPGTVVVEEVAVVEPPATALIVNPLDHW